MCTIYTAFHQLAATGPVTEMVAIASGRDIGSSLLLYSFLSSPLRLSCKCEIIYKEMV
jgi:hypothetical protein